MATSSSTKVTASASDLRTELSKHQSDLIAANLELRSGRLKNHQKIKQLKHDIARTMTKIQQSASSLPPKSA